MLQRDKQTIQGLLIVSYSNVLREVRRGVKGLRLAYLYNINTVGSNQGIRLCELSELTGKNKANCWESMDRAIKAGFIAKRDKRYYLTDKGQTVYNTVCREFDSSMKEIIKVLVEEARRQL